MYFHGDDKTQCCGCGLCSRICPHNAITMHSDDCGFSYPSVDSSLCINCGLCEKHCIFVQKLSEPKPDPKIFAVCNKDDAIVSQSSSGGMFTLMAEEIFRQGGTVYGVAYTDAFRVEHQKAESMESANAFRTSKYVQSDNTILYASVKQDLEEQKPVLVTGTPCQIAGLTEYLSCNRVDTSMLFTCDNICHGVSSPLTFQDYIAALKQSLSADDCITYFNMRHKGEVGSATTLEVRSQKKGVLREIKDFSYYRLFLNRIANRPSCFVCPFTSYNRVGDLSVADFWNSTERDFSFDTSHGVNEVLINTEKGAALFDAIKDRAYIQEVSKEKAWQPHLEYPTQKPATYENFWEEYHLASDKAQVMRKYLKVSPLFKIINFAIPILRKTGLYSFCGKCYKTIFVKNQRTDL